MFRTARLLILIALFAGIWIPAAAVCFKGDVSVDPSSSGPVISWDAEFHQSELVVIGTVYSEHQIPDSKEREFWLGTLYQLRIAQTLKGTPRKSLEVFSPNDSGRMILARGSRYLLFLNERNGRLIADPCGNSARLVYPF